MWLGTSPRGEHPHAEVLRVAGYQCSDMPETYDQQSAAVKRYKSLRDPTAFSLLIAVAQEVAVQRQHGASHGFGEMWRKDARGIGYAYSGVIEWQQVGIAGPAYIHPPDTLAQHYLPQRGPRHTGALERKCNLWLMPFQGGGDFVRRVHVVDLFVAESWFEHGACLVGISMEHDYRAGHV